MDFLKEYSQKLVSADEAVKTIKSGDWVDYGWCNGTPDVLDKALAKRTDELNDVKLRGGILLKPLAIFEREDAGEHFTWIVVSCQIRNLSTSKHLLSERVQQIRPSTGKPLRWNDKRGECI